MRLKIMAKHLLITRIRNANGIINVSFSKDTKVAIEDIFGLRETMAGKLRFLPDGFEINLKSIPWQEAYDTVSSLFTCLLNSDTFNKMENKGTGE